MNIRSRTHSHRLGWKSCLSLLGMFVFMGNATAETRPIEEYRIDPLTEKWRWHRINLTGTSPLPFMQIDSAGNLYALGQSDNVIIYNGDSSTSSPLPAGIEALHVNAFHLISGGVICVATSDSVHLFDGREWSKVADAGIGHQVYYNIMEGHDGILWIGTGRGVLRVDPVTGESKLTPSPTPILSICKGPNGNSLWLSLASAGEVWEAPLSNGEMGEASSWILRHPAMNQVVRNSALLRASDNRIWYMNGHYTLPPAVYDPVRETWEEMNLVSVGGDNYEFSILETRDGTILISSRGTLHAFRNDRWSVYTSPEFPLPGARSLMAEDPDGYLYLREAGGSLLRIDYAQREGRSFEDLHYQDTTARNELVFISSDNEVLILEEGADQAVVHPPSETGISNPVALRATRQGDLFLVGAHERTAAVSIFDGARWTPRYFPDFGMLIGHLGILERANGEVWVGNAQDQYQFPDHAGGIIVFSRDSAGDYVPAHLQPPLVHTRNWSMQEAPDGVVYTSGNGLFANHPTGVVPLELPANARNAWIDQIAVAENGDLWMALWTVGVFRLRDGAWTEFSIADDLHGERPSYILCLNDRFPVVLTQERAYRFDGNQWAPFMPRLGGLHRGSGQMRQAADRSIWINHTHVDWYYRGQRAESYPEEKQRGFRTTQYLPGHRPPSSHWVEKPPELIRETSLTVHFGGQDAWAKTSPEDLRFAHRINDGDWSAFGPDTTLELEGLRGGLHTLEILARNTDFIVETRPLRAEFTVILPLWKQAWFLPAAIFLIVILIALVTLVIRQRVLHLLEIEQVKMRFFTHISHEIKTPLSLILGPVERLQNEITNNHHQHYLSLIKSNSQRLLHLVNQLLDFRQLQLHKLEYRPETGDFIPFARSCITVFQGWAEEKAHDLSFETDLESLTFAFDHDLFHKIIDNLANNAVKYTPPGGQVRVRVRKNVDRDGNAHGIIEVEDSGPGIPNSEKETVFEPFYRSPDLGQNDGGSGIGLSFVKELATMIHARVEIVSPVNPKSPDSPGSCFRVIFPLDLEPNLAAGVPEDVLPKEIPSPQTEDSEPIPEPADQERKSSGEHGDLIVLIEDNADLRTFISDELSADFKVISAENADEGIRLARELIPDIIISDVVMPGKNGFEVSREIKADFHTSHIPVILLTALRSNEHKRQAYESGADDFINKPISSEILRLKILNLLATQKHSREHIRQQFVEDTRVTGLPETDQTFLDKVESLVSENLANDQLNVNLLAQNMGFSRSSFYRKFNSLTGLSPAAYIKTKRLRAAARLLAEGGKSVIEIAFDVGFSDSAYFSRVFKAEYKCSPTEFAKQAKSTSIESRKPGN